MEGGGEEKEKERVVVSGFTSALLTSDRSSFKRLISSFLKCLGDWPTSCFTYSLHV